MQTPASACSYCGTRRAVNQDHVVPKTMRKRYDVPAELLLTVPACFECNIRKGTRKLVPPSWADKIPALKDALPGRWRVWNGDPKSPSFNAGHVRWQ